MTCRRLNQRGNLLLDDDSIKKSREDLYKSARGYCIFPDFLSTPEVNSLKQTWVHTNDTDHFKGPPNGELTESTPNFVTQDLEDPQTTYHNFLWNEPWHAATYSITLQVQLIRNQITDKPVNTGLSPTSDRTVAYNCVRTLGGTPVKPHQDTTDNPLHFPGLQATLFLSDHGKDYSGRGFVFTTNDGEKIVLGRDRSVSSGDLLLWRFGNEHAIADVETTEDQLGFLRIIYPQPRVNSR